MYAHVSVIWCLSANHDCSLTLPQDKRTVKKSWSKLSPLGHTSQHSGLCQRMFRVHLLTQCKSLLFIFNRHFINNFNMKNVLYERNASGKCDILEWLNFFVLNLFTTAEYSVWCNLSYGLISVFIQLSQCTKMMILCSVDAINTTKKM